MVGRHRGPRRSGHDNEVYKTLLVLAAIPASIALVIFLIVTFKDLVLFGAIWLGSLWIFITSIPKRDRSGLWLAGTALALSSLNVLESTHAHIWSDNQLQDLSNVVVGLSIISLAWYFVTHDGKWAADLYRRLRSRLRPPQQPPTTPMDDV